MTERMTIDQYNTKAANEMLEKTLQEHIRKLCVELRAIDPELLYYHTHTSKYSPAGFPDVIIESPKQSFRVVAELKREHGRYQPSDEQVKWLDSAYSKHDWVYLWRPRHWFNGVIQYVITGYVKQFQFAISSRDDGAWPNRARVDR